MVRFNTSQLRIGLLIGCLAAFVAGPASAETLYAQKGQVKVTIDKSPLSKAVATLETGDAVEVLEKSDRHYKVRAPNGKSGWVFKFKLSDEKPGGGKGGSGALSLLTGESTIAAREARSGGSIRGLKEASGAYATYAKNKKIVPAHKLAVDRMDQLTITREELIQFQREGSVGEFAGGGQ